MLFLSGLFPLPVASGGQHRTMQLLSAFRERFDVTLVTHAAHAGFEPHLAALEELCSRVVAVVPANRRGPLQRFAYKVLYWARRLTLAESSDHFYNTVGNVRRAIDAELRRTPFDVVFCMYWFWHDAVFAPRAFTVIDTNDVQSERQEHLLAQTTNVVERILKPRLLRAYRKREIATLRRAQLLIAVTERDRAELQSMVGESPRVVVTPTGLDTAYFAPQPVVPDLREIVFFGALGNPMNIDAVDHLVDDILPRVARQLPDVQLTIVGSSPTAAMRQRARDDARIRVTGFVEDVRPVLSRAGVVVCPLRFAYGIRGRLLEVLSLGVPVVATPVAVQGMGLPDDAGLVRAEGADALAEAIVRVLRDAGERERLAQRGRAFVERHASLEATYGRLARDLEREVASRSGASQHERVP